MTDERRTSPPAALATGESGLAGRQLQLLARTRDGDRAGLGHGRTQRACLDRRSARAQHGTVRGAGLDASLPGVGDARPARCRQLDRLLATGDAAELRAETLQTGYSLARLLAALPRIDRAMADALLARKEIPLPTAFTCAAVLWDIPAADALVAYLWSWAENQVLAAVKAIRSGRRRGNGCLWRWVIRSGAWPTRWLVSRTKPLAASRRERLSRATRMRSR